MQSVDAAAEHFDSGAESAARLATMPYLNDRFARRGSELQAACLNNAALVAIKRRAWRRAADCCDRSLALAPQPPLVEARARFRRAVALAELGQLQRAIIDLQRALKRVPDEPQVGALLKLFERRAAMEQQQLEREREARELGLGHVDDDKVGFEVVEKFDASLGQVFAHIDSVRGKEYYEGEYPPKTRAQREAESRETESM